MSYYSDDELSYESDVVDVEPIVEATSIALPSVIDVVDEESSYDTEEQDPNANNFESSYSTSDLEGSYEDDDFPVVGVEEEEEGEEEEEEEDIDWEEINPEAEEATAAAKEDADADADADAENTRLLSSYMSNKDTDKFEHKELRAKLCRPILDRGMRSFIGVNPITAIDKEFQIHAQRVDKHLTRIRAIFSTPETMTLMPYRSSEPDYPGICGKLVTGTFSLYTTTTTKRNANNGLRCKTYDAVQACIDAMQVWPQVSSAIVHRLTQRAHEREDLFAADLRTIASAQARHLHKHMAFSNEDTVEESERGRQSATHVTTDTLSTEKSPDMALFIHQASNAIHAKITLAEQACAEPCANATRAHIALVACIHELFLPKCMVRMQNLINAYTSRNNHEDSIIASRIGGLRTNRAYIDEFI